MHHRSRDYDIHIRDEAGPSNPPMTEDKGKAKIVNVITLEKSTNEEEVNVMPIGKWTTEEREPNRGVAGSSKKKGKVKEGDDAKTKKKRAPRRKFHVSDFPIGDGQASYSSKEDMANRKADISFGQLMELIPKMKRQWKQLVNPVEEEPRRGSVRVMSVSELPDICPVVDAWHKGKKVGHAYVDGGAQICVITLACVEHLGVSITGHSGFKIRMANHQKVKCLGMVQDLELEVFNVKALVNCHVMPAGMGAFPIILGRPWLRAVGAIQDWRKGVIIVRNKRGDVKKFEMESRQHVLDEDDEEQEEVKDEDSSSDTSSEDQSTMTSESEEEASVAFFMAEEEGKEEELEEFDVKVLEEKEIRGPYEEIEELMKPKMDPQMKQELIQKMLSSDLTQGETARYLDMLSKFPNLFITSYEEIRGFHGEDLDIEVKEDAKPVRQKLRRMGQEQMKALKEEVDKLLAAGFIYLVEIAADWVSPVVVIPKKDGR